MIFEKVESNNSNSLVSVIIPVHNGEQFITDCIKSVLLQQGVKLQVIVIDEDSSDSSVEIIESFGTNVTLLNKSKWGGPSQARNLGIKNSVGDFLVFLDQDDIVEKNHIQHVVNIFHSLPSFQIVHSKIQRINRTGEHIGEPLFQIVLGSMVFRRSVFEEIGMFDESLKISDDFDFFERAQSKNIAIQKLDRVGCYYRRHDSNLSGDPETTIKDFMKMLRRKI